MKLRLIFLICLAVLLVGGITMSRIENVSAPIRMTDDPPEPPDPDEKSGKATNINESTKSNVKVNQGAAKENVKSQVQKAGEAKENVKAGSASTTKVNK
jgi:hypothetical protein